MKKHLGRLLNDLAALAVCVSLVGSSSLYAADIIWIGPNNGDFNSDANWFGGAKPEFFTDQAAALSINSTAVLSGIITNSSGAVAGLKIGQVAGVTSGLRINNGGVMQSIAGTAETGAISVGSGGTGNLTILGGGSASGTSLSLGGEVGSSIVLGDATANSANLTISGNTTLGRTTRVVGQNVDFSSTGNVTFSANSILESEIRHATLHGAVKSAGTATLAGIYRPSFVGVTPAVGNKWTIVDAAAVAGHFLYIDQYAAPQTAGLAYQVITANGGVNGKIVQLSVESSLNVNIDRASGAVSITNPGGGSKTFDGYSLVSGRNTFTGTFSSLSSQAVTGWQVVSTGGTEVSEFNPQNSSTLASPAGSFNLGTPYQQTYPAFGDPNVDDVRFEYTQPDGRVLQGSVTFSTPKVTNDLLLTVNPANGQVQLKNDSPYDIFIDGYSVSSGNSLVPGTWSSLTDQATAGWEESPNPTASVVSELRSSNSMRLTPGSGFNLGALAKTTGTGLVQDLKFQFLEPGHANPSDGVVAYGTLPSIVATSIGQRGDFNGNGFVDAADYVMWRNYVGTYQTLRNDPVGGLIGTGQYNLWLANFGKVASGGSGATLAAVVPEPCTAMIALWTGAGVLFVRSRKASRARD